MSAIKKRFTIKSNLAQAHALVKEMLACLKDANISNDILHDIKLTADEAVINAIKHGNKFREELPVVVDLQCSEDKIIISVEDKGQGYDHTQVPDPTLDENLDRGHGRGVFLIKELMDEIHFNKSGNKIEMIKYIFR